MLCQTINISLVSIAMMCWQNDVSRVVINKHIFLKSGHVEDSTNQYNGDVDGWLEVGYPPSKLSELSGVEPPLLLK